MASKSKQYCSVPQCNNYIGKNISLHQFPKDKSFKEKWKIVLKIGKPITPYMCVCSEHFLPDDFHKGTLNPQKRRLKKGVVPSQKLPVLTHDLVGKKTRKVLMTRLILEDEKIEDQDRSMDIDSSPLDNSIPVVRNVQKGISSYGKYKEPLKDTFCKRLEDKGTQTDAQEFQMLELLDCDKKLGCFTGVTHKVLNDIEQCACNVAVHNSYSVINLKVKLVLVLMKLRLNLPFLCLAVLFNISPATCTRYFYDILELLTVATKPAIYWPTKEEIIANLPKCFEKFKGTRIVLDCTEVIVQKCKCLKCKIKTYSHYKSSQTVKWLVGITPAGLISYISEGYGGRASDKSIVIKEDILSLCNPYDSIMVDKGFLIEKECQEKYLKLIRPPFLKKNKQLTKQDAETTAEIARARVHVERAIQRIKTYKILSEKIHWYLLPHINNIMWVIGSLVNLSPPILGDDKFDECENYL